MTETPMTETFFPGVRKAVRVETFAPLANTAGEKRQRIDFSISLADGQLLGLPEWLTDAVALVQKGRSSRDVSPVQLDGVTIRAYSTLTHDKEVITITGALLKNFIAQVASTAKKADGTLVDVEITFQCYVSWNKAYWDWAVRYYDATTWMSFGTTQAKLTFGPAPTEAELKKKAEAAELKNRQGSLLEPAGEKPIPPPAAVEEIPGGDASFVDVAEGGFFRYEGARWTKLSSTEAVKQMDPNTRVKFAKATRVTIGAGGPKAIAEAALTAAGFDPKMAAANDRDLPETDGLEDDEDLPVFDADRKGNPENDDVCDDCGEGPEADQHQPAEDDDEGDTLEDDDDDNDALADDEPEADLEDDGDSGLDDDEEPETDAPVADEAVRPLSEPKKRGRPPGKAAAKRAARKTAAKRTPPPAAGKGVDLIH